MSLIVFGARPSSSPAPRAASVWPSPCAPRGTGPISSSPPRPPRPHPKLPGTIYTAAKEIEDAGGKALPLVVDVREEANVQEAVEKAVAQFGGIDICVNNASAISLTADPGDRHEALRPDASDQHARHVPDLQGLHPVPEEGRANPHVLMLSPPLDMSPRWFGSHVAYTMAKFGMSMCVLGMAEEFKSDGIAFNALWPRTGIATAAIQFALAGDEGLKHCRTSRSWPTRPMRSSTSRRASSRGIS
jgi:citronellol/citronellal dehydrogenase